MTSARGKSFMKIWNPSAQTRTIIIKIPIITAFWNKTFFHFCGSYFRGVNSLSSSVCKFIPDPSYLGLDSKHCSTSIESKQATIIISRPMNLAEFHMYLGKSEYCSICTHTEKCITKLQIILQSSYSVKLNALTKFSPAEHKIRYVIYNRHCHWIDSYDLLQSEQKSILRILRHSFILFHIHMSNQFKYSSRHF